MRDSEDEDEARVAISGREDPERTVGLEETSGRNSAVSDADGEDSGRVAVFPRVDSSRAPRTADPVTRDSVVADSGADGDHRGSIPWSIETAMV